MGDYLTYSDIWEMLINFGVGPTTRVGNDQVEEHIAGVEGQVNGILLARGYSPIPATNTSAIATIREQARKKVAALVFVELMQPQRSPDFIRTWDIDWAEWLNRLRLGQEKLPGGDVNPTGDALISGFNLGITEVETE